MLKIGCHISSTGGYINMGKTALGIGANVFQFFTRNPRGGKAKEPDYEDMAKYVEFAAANDLGVIMAHAPYTMNLCSADKGIREFAKEMMRDDLNRLEHIPGSLYNFHPGSHVKQGVEAGISFIAEALNEVLWEDMKTTVLLETMAGKGSEIGGKFEELREILDRTKLSHKMGVCLDTCHVNDGGYDVVNDLDGVLEEFDRVVGLEKLKAIHINDSKNPFGSKKDRHEVLGAGALGEAFFEKVINHPKLRDLPFYLETPNELSGYAKEISWLKSLYKE